MNARQVEDKIFEIISDTSRSVEDRRRDAKDLMDKYNYHISVVIPGADDDECWVGLEEGVKFEEDLRRDGFDVVLYDEDQD